MHHNDDEWRDEQGASRKSNQHPCLFLTLFSLCLLFCSFFPQSCARPLGLVYPISLCDPGRKKTCFPPSPRLIHQIDRLPARPPRTSFERRSTNKMISREDGAQICSRKTLGKMAHVNSANVLGIQLQLYPKIYTMPLCLSPASRR